ncbi:MAG: hypothetical protein L0Y72_15940 [Gemmataceae bacterium]|nr:hypothetical protein [Gemmataceae bacterium]MCI0740539.1 hypothetical protein [Gemmataceae bacterium]
MTKPEAARAALIDFLKSGELAVPTAVSAPPRSDNEGDGFVTPSFEAGSLLLRNKEGKFFRLLWEKRAGEKPGDLRRALTPGVYQVAGFHVARHDSQGKEWFVWFNTKHGATVDVHRGQTASVKLDDAIQLDCRPKVSAKGIEIIAHVAGERHASITIYKEGKRIPLGYRVTDESRRVLAEGPLGYD